jgi:hypothetical protein
MDIQRKTTSADVDAALEKSVQGTVSGWTPGGTSCDDRSIRKNNQEVYNNSPSSSKIIHK